MSPSEDLNTLVARDKMQKQLQYSIAKIKTVLLVLSGKGGVGKSSVSVNLAVALAKAGKKTGLLDIDIHGPSIPLFFDPTTELTYSEDRTKVVPARCMENLSVLSVQYLLEDPNSPILWRGPKKHSAIQFFFKDVLWGDLDVLVVDTPPGTGDEHLSIMQVVQKAYGVLVTTPNALSVADVKKTVGYAKTLSISLLGVIENMGTFVCPHCGEATDIFGKNNGAVFAHDIGVPFLGSIPIDMAMQHALEQRIPLLMTEEPSPAKQAYSVIVEAILHELRSHSDVGV